MIIFFRVIYNLNSRDRTVARQLNFNHCVVKVPIQNKSAVRWVVLVRLCFYCVTEYSSVVVYYF